MLSNEVEALTVGSACEALLLTPKARVIAPLRVLRRAANDFLLLTDPGLGEVVRTHLVRSRFAARAEIELEDHESWIVFGGSSGIPTFDYGVAAAEVIDEPPPPRAEELPPEELERLRIEAGTPTFGKEIDERVIPAEAGLVERAVSLTKGCYPGQEPIARLHYRGHANRGLRVLEIEGEAVPEPETEIRFDEKVVGRITSAVRTNGRVVALGYVRREVPAEAVLAVGDAAATPLH